METQRQPDSLEGLRPIRLDAATVAYIKPTHDPEKVKRKYEQHQSGTHLYARGASEMIEINFIDL